MSGLDAFFAFVFESHRRVMSAEGQNQSGAFHAFVADHAKEMDAFRKLKAMQPKQPAHYDGHSPEELENIRVAVYQFSGQVQRLRDKYAAVWDSDEKRRAEIRSRNKG
jgi:hypothetical protein